MKLFKKLLKIGPGLRSIGYLAVTCAGVLLLAQCREEPAETSAFEVNVRLPEDPDMLHPIISKSILATEVETFIFSPMTAIDPVTLDLKPVLITRMPVLEEVISGPDSGMTKLELELRPEAVWDNGEPVTAYDVAFTLKTIFLPGVPSASWRSTLNIIHDIRIDEDNPKRFSLIIKENYFRTIMIATNYEIYPEYHYDPEMALRKVRLADLCAEDPATLDLVQSDSSILAFTDNYQSATFTRNEVEGCGPYRLVFWQDKLQIRLEKKVNWWGDKLADKEPIFSAFPEAINFKIIPDEQSAMAALRSGTVDVMAGIPAQEFNSMRKDSAFQDKFHFFTPSFNRYYFLALNTRDPILNDQKVRLALAHLVDVPQFISVLMEGMAVRTIGHIHPGQPYYRDDLEPIPFDPDQARRLLAEAGWSDTDNDGILDKVIDGRKTPLKLQYLATRRAVGQQMALSMQENARKVGIEIDIVQNDFREHLKAIRKRDFQIVAASKTLPDGVIDPFQTWHSSNDTPEGDNWASYTSPVIDSLIKVIRTTVSEQERANAYSEFQEILYRDQPFIFLLCPTEGIMVSKRFEANSSDLKPGYHPNYFRIAK